MPICNPYSRTSGKKILNYDQRAGGRKTVIEEILGDITVASFSGVDGVSVGPIDGVGGVEGGIGAQRCGKNERGNDWRFESVTAAVAQ